MPADSLIVVLGVVGMFAIFAVTILWADYQTRPSQPHTTPKRRPF
jgi:hypothetical protein